MKQDRKHLIQYWHYLKQHSHLLTLGFILIPLMSVVHLLQPFLFKKAIDDHIMQQDMEGLYIIVIFFGICVTLDFLFRTLQVFIFQFIGQKTVMSIRHDLFNHILNFSSSYYDKTPVGVVASRLTSDIESLNDSFASGLVTLLADLLTLIGIIVIMFSLSPTLTLITLLVVPPMALIVNIFRIKLRYYFNHIRSTIGKMNGYLQEQFQGVSILQLFHQEKNSFRTFSNLNLKYRNYTIGSVTYDAMLYSLIESINSIMIALMIWYGWGQYNQDIVTIGLLVAFIDYIHKFFMPLKEISNKFAILQHALAALEKIFSIFEIKSSISSGHKTLPKVKGAISFKNISFSYPSFKEKKILEDISFDIKPGEVVAIVGATGSGKTTILRLLSKLYENYTGSITLDNVCIKDLQTTHLRKSLAVVSQTNTLFASSIRFNITLGDDSITEDQMINAAQTVQIHDYILSLPGGYDYTLEKGDQSLSAGQAQLISFARALASNSPVILLDEATAAVDSLTEEKIQQALSSLLTQKTTIVIAHRLSTIKHAKTIIALNQGKIIEYGSHETLMKKNGFYANLFNMQFASL